MPRTFAAVNYLAHLLLSGDSPDILIGNFIADSVRGKQIHDYSPEVQRGIRIHRLIDTFTDAHPVVEESRIRLRPAVRKYAGVVVDVIYDHFLARDWSSHSPEPLQDFADRIYAFLKAHQADLPHNSQRFLYYMTSQNILPRYGTLEGMHKVFQGLAHRATFDSGMEHAVKALEADYDQYQAEFEAFFPDLRNRIELELVSR